jgi:hypothetical protein
VNVEQISSDQWEAAAAREMAVQRLLALPDDETENAPAPVAK